MRFLSPARLRNRRPTHRRLSLWLMVVMLKSPGDVAILRYEEWGACQRVHCGASVGRGTGSQPGLGPGGPCTLCPLRSPGRAYSNCPTSGRRRAWVSRQGHVSGKQAWVWEDWREPSDEPTAGRPRSDGSSTSSVPPAPRLALGEAGIRASEWGRGGACGRTPAAGALASYPRGWARGL